MNEVVSSIIIATYYAYCTINAPDKGEVGGSSPPRPTIQITSKYAVIFTFPLFGDLPQKTVLSTVCQLYDWPDGSTLRGVKTLRVKAEQLASIWLCRGCPLSGRRKCKEVQDTASLRKEREGISSQFWEAAGSRPAAPANSKHAISTGTESLNPSAVK